MARELIVFCDESDRDGQFYSEFYGGALIRSQDLDRVVGLLTRKKSELNLNAEVKWEKTTEAYLSKYRELVSEFFTCVRSGHVKVRIMFRQNAKVPKRLTTDQQETKYFRLYYQFIKHAFGLRYSREMEGTTYLRLYFDEFPDKRERAEQFKGFLFGLQEQPGFREAGIRIRMDDITEVKSHDHVVLQCLDLILGAMTFRLNDKHKCKLPGSKKRGKRTVAKEVLYKHILSEIQAIRPGFNIGITTGQGRREGRWTQSYRHWSFLPSDHSYDESLTKRRGSLKHK